jgi:choline kinase
MEMKAILIAAGMGQRLGPYTQERPKCLVEVAGRSMVHRALDALRGVGVRQFIVVRGYQGERLMEALAGEPGVSFVENRDYRRNNILLSLMHAEEAMEGGFFCSYSDIVFRPEVVTALAQSPHDLALVVDPFWAQAYEGRDQHPIAEAELCATSPGHADRIERLGKQAVPAAQACGEFIGLWRASAEGARWLRELYHRRRVELALDKPYGRAPRFEVAYLTDLLNDLIAEGRPLHAVRIAHPCSWREIDTVQDLERAAHVINW